MHTQKIKVSVGYILGVLIISILFFLSYKLGQETSNVKRKELNPIIPELLTRRTDLPINDIDLLAVEYWDKSYLQFGSENNILDTTGVQFYGTYIPTGKQFIFTHNINIYKPGYAPTVTPVMDLYNNYFSKENLKVLNLNGMDSNSWGFCYVESYTCQLDSRYNDLISNISVIMTDANEEQLSKIFEVTLSAFYKRAEALSVKSKSLVPPATLTALALSTITPSPTPSYIYESLVSPDGTKKIQTRDWNKYEILTSDGNLLWTYSYDNKFGVSEPGVEPFHWSKDGRYIYITCYHGPDDSSVKFFGNHFKDGDCIFRLDMNTGEATEILPDMYPGYYAFAISPDDTQLVYTNQNEAIVKIILLDLHTNKEKILFTADENILETGSFGWSPDMNKLLFSNSDKNGIDSIYMFDLETLEIETIISDMSRWFGFESWSDTGKVYYRDTYRALWELDLGNKSFIP